MIRKKLASNAFAFKSVALCGLVLVGLTGCGSDNKAARFDPPPEEPLNGQLTLNVADSAMKGDDPQLALQVTEAILAKDPNNAAAYARQGDAYYALGKVSDAETSYQKALSVQSADVTSRLGLGNLPFIGDRFAGNTQAVVTSVKMGLGRIELGRNPASAESRFADVVAADPQNVAGWNNLGIARDLRGRHPEAQEAYRKALEIAPDDMAAKVNLGLSLAMAGNNEEAIEILRPIAARSDSTPRIRQDYAVALAMGGHTADAVKVLQTDMTLQQATQAVNGYRELPNTVPSRVSVRKSPAT